MITDMTKTDQSLFSSSAEWPGFSMVFANKWEISVQFGATHYCSNRNGDWWKGYGHKESDHRRHSETAEVAIFSPSGAWWSYDEDINEVVEQDEDTCVNGYLTSDQVAKIISIISQKSA